MCQCPERGHHFYIHLWICCISIYVHIRAHTHANTYPHTSISKRAASAWRHNTTPKPKHTQGHAPHTFIPLSPFSTLHYLTFSLCVYLESVSRRRIRASRFSFLVELDGSVRSDSLKVISASLPCWVVMSRCYCCSCCSCCCELNI